MLEGHATAEGTDRYAARFPQLSGHFRRHPWVPGAGELLLPSLGLGTYLGEADAAADAQYTAAIGEALAGGVNLLDAAINYRHQRSERNIGEALRQAFAAGTLRREEVVACSKAGYLPFDGEVPADPRAYLVREYVESGILDPKELAGGMHCMAPRYLADQLERSRRNLGLATIDVFYLHNPETQLEAGRERFRERLRRAFDFLEQAAEAGRLRWYGTATWNGYRVAKGHDGALELSEVVEVARAAGGDGHRFRFVQLPFNLAMLEAFALENQQVGGEQVSLLEAGRRLGVLVVGSATLFQAQLTRGLPPQLAQQLGTRSDAETAIQFARSAPGVATALVGMGRPEHVRVNLGALRQPPAAREPWEGLFRRE